MKISKKTKKAGMFVATASVIIIVLFSVFATGLLQPTKAKPNFPADHLFVEEIYLLKTGETNTTVNVTCIPYLTNIWEKESGEIKIIVYVVQTSNKVAEWRNAVEIGEISANSTAEIEVPIVLSENTYKVDMLIFENGKLVLKGSLSIKAYQTHVYGDDLMKDYDWNIENEYAGFHRVRHN